MSEDKLKTPDASQDSPDDNASSGVTNIIKYGNREFDVSTEVGKAQLTGYMQALESTIGKKESLNHDLQQEVEPLRKYGIKRPSVDKLDIMKQVEKLQEEGESSEAFKLMFEYVEQTEIASKAEAEEARLWADYTRSRKDMFNSIDEDVYKDYVFRNYREELEESADPFSLIDRILQPKAAKYKAPVQEDDGSYASLTGGTAPARGPKAEDKPEEKGAMDKLFDEMGFK